MLTVRGRVRSTSLTFLSALVALGGLILCPCDAKAEEDETRFKLLLEPDQRDYSYRKINRDKTINIMLYGLKDYPQQSEAGGSILKDRKALNAFFDQHLKNIRHDYLNNEENTFRFMAGDESFTSRQLNNGIEMQSAKMAGLTIPIGKFTIGGGYTWGEKNPALMMESTEGLFAGASYDTGRMGFQVSYLTSGQDVMGFEIGGANYHYNSVLIGTSFRVNNRMGLTATMQYRADDDPLTTGDRMAVFTIGTKWKF